MKLVEDLLASVAAVDCPVKRVCVGLHWTVVESRYVGVAHTCKTNTKVEIEHSGSLAGRGALELAERLRSWKPLEASLGVAALNSLIEPAGDPGNVFDVVLQSVQGKTVTIIGRFPDNERIGRAAARAFFLEMEPQASELPPYACEEVIPESDLVVITASALINKTLPRLLELSSRAWAVVLGPSTPMNDVLIRHGADILAGIRVTDPDALVESVMQGVKGFKRLAGIEPLTRTAA
ncbi:MAG: DUF364 domain-containing protein [Gemmatimonadota bacterium]|nr:MAG: DUF364 domain-containing protein [Gemmatimonadota bacterium]